jgi:Na+/proline symporter
LYNYQGGPYAAIDNPFSHFIAIPAIAVYVFALLDKRKNAYGGVMTYTQGFIAGLIITLLLAILSPLTQYLISTVITPDYFSNAINYAVIEGKMTQAEAEKYFSLSNYMIQATIGALIMGIVTSAIVALFTSDVLRRKKT